MDIAVGVITPVITVVSCRFLTGLNPPASKSIYQRLTIVTENYPRIILTLHVRCLENNPNVQTYSIPISGLMVMNPMVQAVNNSHFKKQIQDIIWYPKHPFLIVFTKDYPLSREFESSIIGPLQ